MSWARTGLRAGTWGLMEARPSFSHYPSDVEGSYRIIELQPPKEGGRAGSARDPEGGQAAPGPAPSRKPSRSSPTHDLACPRMFIM